MASKEDWLLSPVAHGMCLYESLKTGAVTLEDIARMNDFLDVKAENERRITRAMEKK